MLIQFEAGEAVKRGAAALLSRQPCTTAGFLLMAPIESRKHSVGNYKVRAGGLNLNEGEQENKVNTAVMILQSQPGRPEGLLVGRFTCWSWLQAAGLRVLR